MGNSKPIGASYFSQRLTELMRARGLITALAIHQVANL